MMAGERRAKSNSIEEQVRVMIEGQKEIVPPAHVELEEDDMPFWDSVIAEFARSDWTAHQLELAAMLARTMADLEREQRLLREEGSIMSSEKGTPVVNPRKSMIQMHAGTILSFRRSLQLHALAHGDPRTTADRRKAAKEIEADNPLKDDDESLIARPMN